MITIERKAKQRTDNKIYIYAIVILEFSLLLDIYLSLYLALEPRYKDTKKAKRKE